MFDVVFCRLRIVAIVAIVAMWCAAYYGYCGIGCHTRSESREQRRWLPSAKNTFILIKVKLRKML